jgi:spore coat protein U-like protein
MRADCALTGARLLAAAAVLQVLGIATADAAATCSLAATGVSFGAYDAALATPSDSVGSVTVTCSHVPPGGGDSVSYALMLSPGFAGTFAPRTLVSTGGALQYNLYTDPARRTIWGNGIGGTGIVSGRLTVGRGVGNSTRSQTYPIYGRIPPLQSVGTGNYLDTITVTIEF